MRSRYPFAVLIAAGLALLSSLPSPADEVPRKEKIDQLIKQMGSGSFAEREKAAKELVAIGVPALDALRKTAKSGDAEIKRRAEGLVKKIAKQAEIARVLAPKRIHLLYKNTPLREAVADFRKKSGRPIYLYDRRNKLKGRTITLDTGDTTYWHAVELFRAKAGLTEAIRIEDNPMYEPKKIVKFGYPPSESKQALPPRPTPEEKPKDDTPWLLDLSDSKPLLLEDGKAPQRPTDDSKAVRFRIVLGARDLFKDLEPAPQGEVRYALEIASEPGQLHWQALRFVRIDKALDDRGQTLTQVRVPPRKFIDEVDRRSRWDRPNNYPNGPFGTADGFWCCAPLIYQQMPFQLKKGDNAARVLKELQGVLSAKVKTGPRPRIVADHLTKAAGKTFPGPEGGSFKILDVKTTETETTVQFEFQPTPETEAALELPPLTHAREVARERGRTVRAERADDFVGPIDGLIVEDDEGEVLPLQIKSRWERGRGGVGTLICRARKGQRPPARLVYLGCKELVIEIPFTLKNVPLP